ncbi:MAG: exosortase/archaeosortase family protein [Verrucomicrobiota bacterium]
MLKPESQRSRWNGGAWLIALAGVWFWTWRHLEIEWRLNEQYQYGYFVPLLSLYLGWERLKALPPGDLKPASSTNVLSLALVVLSFTAFLFAELLRQQDPTWRMVAWTMNGSASLLTAVCLWHLGGAPLLKALSVPLLFTWLALPWPSFFENGVTLALMRLVTSNTVDLLNWSGIAALQRGNVIELANGMVGVDTACSGVQSLQASLVASLCIGELLRFRLPARAGLVLAGGLCAWAGNLARVYVLTRLVQAQGESAVDRYHDMVGYTATAFTFGAIFLLAWLLARRPTWQINSEETHPAPFTAIPRLPGSLGFTVLALVVATPLLCRIWWTFTRSGPPAIQREAMWTLRTSQLPRGWSLSADQMSAREKEMLRFSEAQAVSYRLPDGQPAHAYRLFWKPDRTVPSLAFSHTPDICLVQAGWQQVSLPEIVTLKVAGATVTGALFRFQFEGVEQAVLHCRWYGGEPEMFQGATAKTGARTERLTQLWKGRRRYGHEALTVFMPPLAEQRRQRELLEHFLNIVLAPAGRSS